MQMRGERTAPLANNRRYVELKPQLKNPDSKKILTANPKLLVVSILGLSLDFVLWILRLVNIPDKHRFINKKV